MARQNVPFLAFNRGLISPKALARTDLDRTRLSAEVYNNWLPKTQGAMFLRPGTKYVGSSLLDASAEWIEFVSSTDDVALVELTQETMRVWLGEDAHELSLLGRPAVETSVSFSDTGSWTGASLGGAFSTQAQFSAGALILNATSVGALARMRRSVTLDTGDRNVEHALAIDIARGPVTLRVGSDTGTDDYIAETALGTGFHNLAFTPGTKFHITLQTAAIVNRIVRSLSVGDSGTVELTTGWGAADLKNVRYDQTADVVYVDCDGVRPRKIERRGTGRSWSVVDYAPNDGPFLAAASSSAKLAVDAKFGNSLMSSNIPFFVAGHEGALFRLFHQGQTGTWRLGDSGAVTDAIAMTGISDTGTPGSDSERRIVFSVTGTWAGTITMERSIEGPDVGFKPVPASIATATDTGTFSRTIDDPDDNLKVWYRARLSAYISGVPVVVITYGGGGVTGVARVTQFNSSTQVEIEVLKRFSQTTPTDNWQQGYWSDARGFPTATALHSGRLGHAQGGSIFLSVSDDYESFDEGVDGDAGPIIRTLGSGPVDNIRNLISLLRLIINTSGAELTLKSSSLDEPVTPDNSSAVGFSTQGSANLRAVKMDARGIYVQRSGQRVFMVGPNTQGTTFGDYENFELTLLVPDLLEAGVVSVAVQRQPDTRVHCVLGDGTVAILTYEPQEEVICWTTWETDGVVEKAAVLPGLREDAVFYHVRRGIGGSGNDAFAKVLLHLDGADASTKLFDVAAGGSPHTWEASGNAQIDTAQSKFGGASLLCDGTGDYISTADHDDFKLGSGDFTIDFWFRCNAASGTAHRIAGQCDSSGSFATASFRISRTTGNVIQATTFIGSTSFACTGTTQFTNAVNTGWHHVAFVRTGNTLKLFIDGTQEGSDQAISGTVNDSPFDLSVGTEGELTVNTWNGWIDEFRLSVGVARWTSAFTAPTAAHGGAVRYLEKWALESECVGDTGLTWLMDCAKSFTDTGRTATLTGFSHLAGESVVVWSDDTGSIPGVDRSPDVDGVQTTYTVDTGAGTVTLSVPVRHAVVGLPFTADWKSTKLAYAAELGTALAQKKRVPQTALALHQCHNNSLFLGSDTGDLWPLPRVIDGATVDPDQIHESIDIDAFASGGPWKNDSRLHLRAKAPRPATVLALVPTVVTSEK